jgi:uncharacterized damage-inducible protein DinB
MEPLAQPWAEVFVQAYLTDHRVTEYLLQHLPDDSWAMKPPSGRSIADIVAHMHNVRIMWLKAANVADLPRPLERGSTSLLQAQAALRESRNAVVEVIRAAFDGAGKVRGFPPSVAHFIAYQIAHEAHHRGQICMLARQLGFRLPQEVGFGMWDYSKRSKEAAKG